MFNLFLQPQLGNWTFQSRAHGTDYDGYLFPLHVTEVLDFWPEKNNRQRIWVCTRYISNIFIYIWTLLELSVQLLILSCLYAI